ncbi:MAG: helix-turn-helix domain-containing protein [Parcubacteria group bacterium]|jgi:sugar-specific transcriptional regulator TrmB
MLQDNLQKIGLDKKESQVYLALLELGSANIGQIAKKSAVKRTTVYDILDSLKEKGLLGQTKSKNHTLFFAENPEKLERQIEEKKKIILKVMPELLSIANRLEKKPKIKFFEGKAGIKEVYEDTLKYPDQEILAWATDDALKYFDAQYLWHEYVPARIKNRIWERTIAPNNEQMRHVKSYDQKHLRQIRFAPENETLFEVEINLYGKKLIGIMAFEEQIGLIIESEKIFNTLKSIFEINWKALEK